MCSSPQELSEVSQGATLQPYVSSPVSSLPPTPIPSPYLPFPSFASFCLHTCDFLHIGENLTFLNGLEVEGLLFCFYCRFLGLHLVKGTPLGNKQFMKPFYWLLSQHPQIETKGVIFILLCLLCIYIFFWESQAEVGSQKQDSIIHGPPVNIILMSAPLSSPVTTNWFASTS